MKNKITGETTIDKILKLKGADKVLEKYNVPCLFCPMAALEIHSLEIGRIAEMYGIDLKGLLEELNRIKN